MSRERDYVLGTHDEENARLLLQHRVWRPRALDAWRRAGFTVGQTLLDLGCGPGHAAVDLAEIVGPTGRVFAFVKQPRELLARVGGALKPGGVLVVHEYFDYRTWRLAPRSPEIEEFVRVVMESWRADGGEPDIGLDLPGWLDKLGFAVTSLRPIIDVVPPSNFVWQWPAGFIRVGLARLVELGHLTAERACAIADGLAAREAAPQTLMVTPALLEIIAVRR